MKLATVGDEKAINAIINHPSIRSLIMAGDHELDVTGLLEDQIYLFDESGVFMVEGLGGDEFIAMSAFLPEARGLKAHIAHRKALDILFFGMGAGRVYATVDRSNTAAVRNLLGLGFNIRDENFRIIAHIDYMEWAQKSKTCYSNGRDLAMFLFGSHMSYVTQAVGAFVMSARSGLAGIAMMRFNKFALLNQIEPIMAEDDNVFVCGLKKFSLTDSGFKEG